MTVGGRTIGSATKDCTSGRAADRVRAIHQAMGVEISSRMTIVTAASRIDSQSGSRFTTRPRSRADG